MKNIYTLLFLLLCFTVFSQSVTHGPIVGSVSDTSCRVFIRTDAAASVSIELSTGNTFGTIAATNTVLTDAAKDTVAIAILSGLLPDTKYYVRAVISGSPSGVVSSFTTFPVLGAPAHQVFTSGSCHYDLDSPDSSLYVRMAMDNPRVFIQSGDWGYPDADSGTIGIYLVSPPTSYAARIENHRTFYKKRYSCLGSFTFLHNFPVDYVYDDHDFLNDNCADDAVSGFGLNLLNSFGAPKVYSQPPIARLNSIEAYQEWFPSYQLIDSTEGIYHSFRSGNVEIFVPDLRSMRTPQASAVSKVGNQWIYNPPPGYSIMGAKQTAWLKNGLMNSTATWKIIISSDAFNIGLRMTVDSCLKIGNGSVTYWAPDISGITIPNYGYTAEQNYADCWAGFKEDCDSLVKFVINNNIKNVFVVSGDSHTVGLDDGENSGLPELNCGILKKANSEEWVTNEKFMGFNIWNKGGSGLCGGTNFESAYSKVETFGDDSLRLSAVDATGFEITGWTFKVNEPYKYNPLYHPNHIPVAVDDITNVSPNNSTTISVAGNDSDFENDPLYVNLKTIPTNGTAIVNSNNTVTYIPNTNYTGTDTFLYTICDHTNASCLNCATAKVTVSVGASSVLETSTGTIQVYPNPASNTVFIHSTSSRNMEIQLLNLMGESILKQNITGSGSINTSQLPSGDYILTVTDSVTTEIKKTKLSIAK